MRGKVNDGVRGPNTVKRREWCRFGVSEVSGEKVSEINGFNQIFMTISAIYSCVVSNLFELIFQPWVFASI